MVSTFFPPAFEAETPTKTKVEAGFEEDNEEGQTTEAATEILSQLPDAPTDEPVDIDDAEEPSQKKQKTGETSDDDFVVVDKEATDEAKPKAEL